MVEVLCTSSKPRPQEALYASMLSLLRDPKKCQIKSAKISRSAQLICTLVSKKKCLLHATELL